jgi:hypothetical protein
VEIQHKDTRRGTRQPDPRAQKGGAAPRAPTLHVLLNLFVHLLPNAIIMAAAAATASLATVLLTHRLVDLVHLHNKTQRG